MTDIYNPDDTSGSPVAAIVRVADRTPDDEATVDVIYSDPQMISKNNLDVLVKTYIGYATVLHLGTALFSPFYFTGLHN
jgi:hypothetical protein